MGGWLIVGALLGVLAVVTGLEADTMSDIARDPPKPHEKPVAFLRRVSQPPGRSDPIAGRLGLPIQYGVAALVTMQGLLDALERSEGARGAGDIDWAVIHTGVARIAGRTLTADLAYQGWALAAGRAPAQTIRVSEVPASSGRAIYALSTRSRP